MRLARRGRTRRRGRAPGRTLALAAACLVAAACGPRLRRLDDAPMYAGPRFELRAVRYFERLPLHYTGEVFRIQCRSDRTAGAPARPDQDAGWRTLGSGGAIGTRSARDVAEAERAHYLVLGPSILAWLGLVIHVSFDACGGFATWDPTTLPPDRIAPAPRPAWCAPEGGADCRYEDFRGERAPVYEDVRADASGRVSFRVRSSALRPTGALRVESDDFGATWRVADEPAPGVPAARP